MINGYIDIYFLNMYVTYENAIVENALEEGVYKPGPGTPFADIKDSLAIVFIPITYCGPSTIFSGMLYWPGPGIVLSVINVFLADLPIL